MQRRCVTLFLAHIQNTLVLQDATLGHCLLLFELFHNIL